MSDLREELAAVSHEIWAHWMKHVFSRAWDQTDERFHDLDRWRGQMNTPYAHLAEDEKNSDRNQADKILAVIEPYISAQRDDARHTEQARCVTLAHMTPIEKPSQTEIDELHFFTGGLPVDDGEAWAYYHAEAIAQAIDHSCKEAQEYRATIREETDHE